MGSTSLLQGIFPTQESNPGLPHCRWILYHLSHQGSPRILEWVAIPFSRGSSRPRIELGFPALQAILYQMSYQGSPNKGQGLYFSITELCFYLQLHAAVVETRLWSLQDKLNQFKVILVGSRFPTFLFPP